MAVAEGLSGVTMTMVKVPWPATYLHLCVSHNLGALSGHDKLYAARETMRQFCLQHKDRLGTVHVLVPLGMLALVV